MSSKVQNKKRPAPEGAQKSSHKSAKFNKSTGPRKSDVHHKSAAVKPKSGRDVEEDAPKRKRPITSNDAAEVEDVEDDEYQDDNMEVDQVEGDAGASTSQAALEKRPRMTKAERQALHAAQPHRTALLPSHPLLQDTLLPLWEKARRADLGKEERKQAIAELWESAKGRVAEISRGHKGGRVLQTIVKYGGKEERLGVAMELQPKWRAMMESKYSKFLMGKLIRYCPSIRPLLAQAIAPHITSLLFHSEAVVPLSDFYELYATSKERKLLVSGFFPKEATLFESKSADTPTLEEVLVKIPEGKGKERILEHVGKAVQDIFNSPQKKALAQGIFHRLALDYMTCIYRFLDHETADAKMREVLSAALESLADIVHTKDGSAVVRELIVRGNAKDRKQILQVLRKHDEAMCKDAEAQMVLFTAFDCVDDTKLMGKAFVSDIIGFGPTLAFDKVGRRALTYLLAPLSTRHSMPSVLQSLAASAQKAREIGTSKKDPNVRRQEIKGYASEGLLKLVEDKGDEMVRDPAAGLVVQEIMLSAEGDKTKAVETLLRPVAEAYAAPSEEEDDSTHVLNMPHATRTYKLLLSGGHFNSKLGQVEVVDAALSSAFAQAFWTAISSEEVGGATNAVEVAKGVPFVVLELVNALVAAWKGAEVKKALGSKSVRDAVGASEQKGAALLVERLASL